MGNADHFKKKSVEDHLKKTFFCHIFLCFIQKLISFCKAWFAFFKQKKKTLTKPNIRFGPKNAA